jgi:hypothetical protein
VALGVVPRPYRTAPPQYLRGAHSGSCVLELTAQVCSQDKELVATCDGCTLDCFAPCVLTCAVMPSASPNKEGWDVTRLREIGNVYRILSET